jgi:hypothetical protein
MSSNRRYRVIAKSRFRFCGLKTSVGSIIRFLAFMSRVASSGLSRTAARSATNSGGKGRADEDGEQLVFSLEREDDAALLGTDIQLELFARDVAPVRKVVAENRRNVVVHRRADGARETGVASVGADG